MEFLTNLINSNKSNYSDINLILKEICGINDFFENQNDIQLTLDFIEKREQEIQNQSEYGDFQTNSELSDSVVNFLLEEKRFNPDVVIEPTCGKGNFIISTLKVLKPKKIFAIEIFKPYIIETKVKVLNYFLESKKNEDIPDISIYHQSIFDFSFNSLNIQPENKILIIGNPPWVTNSELSQIASTNLPTKTNFKGHSGFDAITGKGNFDIAEFISLMIIKEFSTYNGKFAFLIKNSVVKNLIFEQKRNQFLINNIEKYNINSRKEFNVSVEASLFLTDLSLTSSYTINEFDFYSKQYLKTYGWLQDKFVADIEAYSNLKNFDGKCSLVWRQGMKHDCSSVMDFEKIEENKYINGLKEIFEVESDLVFGLIKSSDLKEEIIDTTRKNTLVTQRKIGELTDYIKKDFPLTYKYLNSHIDSFNARKSSIYNDKPPFSIFGIGDYSFKKFKVSISGLYKKTTFSLVMPINDKPTMLDDTCYFLGFDDYNYALITLKLLNSNKVQDYLKSIVFFDAKRPITKDILMRLDIKNIALETTYSEIDEVVDESVWHSYIEMFSEQKEKLINPVNKTRRLNKDKIQNQFELPFN